MRNLLLAATFLAALGSAHAATIDLFTANAFTDTLSLVAVPPPGNQPLNEPCLICGTNQPQQPADFGYNNYKQGGNVTSFAEFSSSTVGAKLNQDELGTPYLASFLRLFLLSKLDLDGTLNVGIDVNTATGHGPEVLERFAILDLGNHTILSDFNPVGGVALPTFNNGTGFPDYLLTGFNIDRNDINANSEIMFFSRWSNTSDGAESFFLVPRAGNVPEPSTWVMLGVGFGLMAFFGFRRKRTDRLQTI